jgi:hypothetical protein
LAPARVRKARKISIVEDKEKEMIAPDMRDIVEHLRMTKEWWLSWQC